MLALFLVYDLLYESELKTYMPWLGGLTCIVHTYFQIYATVKAFNECLS